MRNLLFAQAMAGAMAGALVGPLTSIWVATSAAIACPAPDPSRPATDQIEAIAGACESEVLGDRLFRLAAQHSQTLGDPVEKAKAEGLLFAAALAQDRAEAEDWLTQAQATQQQIANPAERLPLALQLAYDYDTHADWTIDESKAALALTQLYDRAYRIALELPDASAQTAPAQAAPGDGPGADSSTETATPGRDSAQDPAIAAAQDSLYSLALWYLEDNGSRSADPEQNDGKRDSQRDEEKFERILAKIQDQDEREFLREQWAEVQHNWADDTAETAEAAEIAARDGEELEEFTPELFPAADQKAIAQIETLLNALRSDKVLTPEHLTQLQANANALTGDLSKLIYIETITETLAQIGEAEATAMFAERLFSEIQDYAGDALVQEAQNLLPEEALPEFMAAILLARFEHLESALELIAAQSLMEEQKQFQQSLIWAIAGAIQLGEGDPTVGHSRFKRSQEIALAMPDGLPKAESLVAIGGIQLVLDASAELSDEVAAATTPEMTAAETLIDLGLALEPGLQPKVDAMRERVAFIRAYQASVEMESDSEIENQTEDGPEDSPEISEHAAGDPPTATEETDEADWLWLDSPIGSLLPLLKAGNYAEAEQSIEQMVDPEVQIDAGVAFAAYLSQAGQETEAERILGGAIAAIPSHFGPDSATADIWLSFAGEEFVQYGGDLRLFQAVLQNYSELDGALRREMERRALAAIHSELEYGEAELRRSEQRLAEILPQPDSELRSKILIEIAENFAILEDVPRGLALLEPLPPLMQIEGWLQIAATQG